jgi:hypothetical protein
VRSDGSRPGCSVERVRAGGMKGLGVFDIGNMAAEIARDTKQELTVMNARLLVIIDLLQQVVDNTNKEED